MTLDEVKNEIKAYPHKVITKSHVLTLLESIERDDRVFDGDLPTNRPGRFARLVESHRKASD